MHRLLGVEVPDAAQGVLQDVHWGAGLFGYFPTYTLGNLIAAQLWTRLSEDLPEIDAQLASGELAPLREWLREHIHRHGRKFPPRELLLRATGDTLRPEPFLDYLRAKLRRRRRAVNAGIAHKLRARQRPPVPARSDLTGLHHPTETPANALAHRQLNNALAIAAREHARGRLLDVGCGEKPYAPLFRDLVDEHVGVDHPESIHPLSAVDVLATAYDIPLEDAVRHCCEPCRRQPHPVDAVHVAAARGAARLLPLLPHGLRHPAAGVRPGDHHAGRGQVERRWRPPPVRVRTVQWVAVRLDELHFQPTFSWDHVVVATKA